MSYRFEFLAWKIAVLTLIALALGIATPAFAGSLSSKLEVEDQAIYLGEGGVVFKGRVKSIRPDGQVEIAVEIKQAPYPSKYEYYGSAIGSDWQRHNAEVKSVFVPRKFVLHAWQDSVVAQGFKSTIAPLLGGVGLEGMWVFALAGVFMDQCSPSFCAGDIVKWRRGSDLLTGKIETIYRQDSDKKVFAHYQLEVMSKNGVAIQKEGSMLPRDYAVGSELQAFEEAVEESSGY